MGKRRSYSISTIFFFSFLHVQGWSLGISSLALKQRTHVFATITPRRLPVVPLQLAISKTDVDILGGVSDFEFWFSELEGRNNNNSNSKVTAEANNCDSSIRHYAFGSSLRGLTCSPELDGTAITVPKKIVLSSYYGDDDWDSQLALRLWKECILGKQSELNGYCSLLTRGCQVLEVNSVPPSTAPDTLRHWTNEQLDELSLASPRGNKLRKEQDCQEMEWRNKYQAITYPMTWEQFQWCMEVVHSRAFRGTYGLSPIRFVASAAAPLAAAAIGMGYMQGNADIQDSVLLGLAALATSAFLFNLIVPDKGEVVLLPFVDSANHLESADSSIQYDPLKGTFSLAVGPNCVVREGEETQLYISYGPKSDSELLLNYGFLPDVSFSDVEKCSSDSYRRRLIEAYTQNSQ